MQKPVTTRKATIVSPGEGRAYAMGPMRAVFKADTGETQSRYSVSEWWLEPRTRGPHVHSHADDHVFYVIEGTITLHLDGEWREAEAGSYALIPGGTEHSFENRGAVRAGFISFNSPGGFEDRMPDIAAALAAEDLSM